MKRRNKKLFTDAISPQSRQSGPFSGCSDTTVLCRLSLEKVDRHGGEGEEKHLF